MTDIDMSEKGLEQLLADAEAAIRMDDALDYGSKLDIAGVLSAGRIAANGVSALVAEVRELRAALSDADAMRDRLYAQVEEMRRARDDMNALRMDNLNKLLAAERARDAMAEALQRYGEHDGDCAASVVGCAGDTKCTCGYDAALDKAREGTK